MSGAQRLFIERMASLHLDARQDELQVRGIFPFRCDGLFKSLDVLK